MCDTHECKHTSTDALTFMHMHACIVQHTCKHNNTHPLAYNVQHTLGNTLVLLTGVAACNPSVNVMHCCVSCHHWVLHLRSFPMRFEWVQTHVRVKSYACICVQRSRGVYVESAKPCMTRGPLGTALGTALTTALGTAFG